MKESQPLPAIAVSLATSLVAAPYLLIRNDYHIRAFLVFLGACLNKARTLIGVLIRISE